MAKRRIVGSPRFVPDGGCRICKAPLEIKTAVEDRIRTTPYRLIIEEYNNHSAFEGKLTKVMISRHKIYCLRGSQKIHVPEVRVLDPVNKAALTKSVTAIAGSAIPIPDALMAMISVGLHNLKENPQLMTPSVTLQAIDILRKLGLASGAKDAFADAWGALAEAQAGKTKRKRRITVEEEVTSEADAIVINPVPDEWDADELAGIDSEEEE
jgi:hypothetical protein